MRYFYTKQGRTKNGWQDALARFFHIFDGHAAYFGGCGYPQTIVYVPKFILAHRCNNRLRSRIYGKKIVIEIELEEVEIQYVINIGSFTDFTHPVSQNADFPQWYCGLCARRYQRTVNLSITLSQAHLFLLGFLDQIQGRSLNLITLSCGSADNIIQSFGSLLEPNLVYSRHFLARV